MPSICLDAACKAADVFPPLKRGRKKSPKVEARHLGGRNYLATLKMHLAGLRTLYPHHLRVLFYDDVVLAYLLAFFSPTPGSLRRIEDASQLPGVKQYLSVESVCKITRKQHFTRLL